MAKACPTCEKEISIRKVARGKIRANLVFAGMGHSSKLSTVAEIRGPNGGQKNIPQRLSIESKIRAPEPDSRRVVPPARILHGPHRFVSVNNAKIQALVSISGNMQSRLHTKSIFDNDYVDKIGGTYDSLLEFDNFLPTEKLFPSGDINIASGDSYFVNKDGSSGNLYASIDEGIAVGNYVKSFKTSSRITDDLTSYITPSSLLTVGSFNYKLELTAPVKSIEDTFLMIRASAPVETYTAKVAPEYTLSNLRFEDPSGNLIAKYKDIKFRGDADYSIAKYKNFTTYVSEPEITNTKQRTYASGYPVFGEASGYTLNVDVNVKCKDDPFTNHNHVNVQSAFSFGFKKDECTPEFIHPFASEADYLALVGSPISTMSQQPYLGRLANNLRISAIEIINSGGVNGIARENKLDMYLEVPLEGNVSKRDLTVNNVLSYNEQSLIYPTEEHSVWQTSGGKNNLLHNNDLQDILNDPRTSNSIELASTSSVADSGKLRLKISHQSPTFAFRLADGEYSEEFTIFEFRSAQPKQVAASHTYFVVEDVELKIVAKKASGSRDYVIDVVGYSDDKLLNVTPKVGGFLQNTTSDHPSGIGVAPVSSGFSQIDELGISTESIADHSQYFETSGTNNFGGDHYGLATGPAVSGLGFEEYTIPLSIYKDKTTLGDSQDYSSSNNFEHLYLDIFPFPSGASIAHVALTVRYKPSNGLSLNTLGHSNDDDLHRALITAYPSGRQQGDDRLFNSVVQNSGLSLIDNIPHGYTSPSTIKTNYARRWRGVDGNIVNGSFDRTEFDFSFNNPQLVMPFLSGFYNFNDYKDNFILSDTVGDSTSTISGFFNSNIQESIINNVGLRFNTSGLFPSWLQQRSYKTIDWTPYGHEISGKILDSFDKAIRISGVDGNINFGSGIPVSSGFSAYIRFSPDVTISGSSYNLWNSGVLLSKWDDGKNLEFTLGYSGGHLCGKARSNAGNIISIYDSQDYTNYQYPLSVLLTYNDNLSSGLKLYADSDIASGDYNILRAASSTFDMASGDSTIVAGYSHGSGVGINAFVTEIGLSSYNASGSHIVEASGLSHMQHTTAESFFDGHRAKFWNAGETYQNDRNKFWSYVDENVDKWHIGAFSICEFNQDFDRFTKRIGGDFINFRIKHDGSGYQQITNTTMPSGEVITSGLAYHTQLENDMLRLDIATIPDGDSERLYAVTPRISKKFPTGYSFEEKGLCIETIIQNDIDKQVVWNDGKEGAKLIVSLYAPQFEPKTHVTKNNGLVNRHYHYLPMSGCWRKLSSTFTYDDFVDTSEPWAEFSSDNSKLEFQEKYKSSDLDKMFVQYDIAYPSGKAFDSTIKLHSINLKAHDALASGAVVNASGFNLYASGESIRTGSIDLYVNAKATVSGVPSGLVLCTSGMPIPLVSGIPSGLFLYTSGVSLATHSHNNDPSGLNLYSAGSSVVIGFDSSKILSEGMFGHPFDEWSFNPAINLVVEGKAEQDLKSNLPLFVSNTGIIPQSSGDLNLFIENTGVQGAVTLSGAPPLFVHGSPQFRFTDSSSMSLFTVSPTLKTFASGDMNLMTTGGEKLSVLNSASAPVSFNLYLENYLPAVMGAEGNLQTINWTNVNVGQGITTDEEGYAYLDSDDEIRGVDLICFGACGQTLEQCDEPRIIVHGEEFGGDCVEGGIFRAKRLYTNLATSGFKTDVGYENNYYGIRKFTGLIPDAPYNINIFGITGSNERKEIPRELQFEYGSNEDVNFSGIKIIGDGIAGASGVTSSGVIDKSRNAGDEFGKAVKVKGDYMVVGSPYKHLTDVAGYDLGEAGSVSLYKRNPAPSGFDWSAQDDKAGFSLTQELVLPLGTRRDYFTTSLTKKVLEIDNKPLEFAANVSNWRIGQEGRNMGYSVDLSCSGDPTIVVGAPGGKFSRTFSDIETSGVDIALLVFARPFTETIEARSPGGHPITFSYRNIVDVIQQNNITYKFFANPAIKLNPKVIVIEPVLDRVNVEIEDIQDPEAEPYVAKFAINNHGARSVRRGSLEEIAAWDAKDNQIFNQIQEIFHGTTSGVFPYDASKSNNNIPPILGIYVDNSFSMGQNVVGTAIDKFKDWYKAYSLASGVTDIFGDARSGSIYEKIDSKGLNWVTTSQTLLDEVLETGRLISNGDFSLFANRLGEFRSEADAFNINPPSGGAVFIWREEINEGKKEWNAIQEINSPETSNTVGVDRYGHAVAISDDANVIAIGSPYIDEGLQIWQKDEQYTPDINIGNWLSTDGPKDNPLGYIRDMQNRYNSIAAVEGKAKANASIFETLNASGKLTYRRYESSVHAPSPYMKIGTRTHTEMKPLGHWDWLYEKFAPTPRLGYSVAVNEDGSMVAAGAPTDSHLSPYNSIDLWWRPNTDHTHNWRSSVNAGSVTVFESRKYYPTNNKIVEYTRLGNKHRALNIEKDGELLFNHMSAIYQDMGKTFTRLENSEVDIPNDAETVFIITPELEFSDEIVKNIQDYLALGDRHLVLVSDDPEFEQDGAYAKTHEIVNNLLRRLDSRLALTAAKNSFEALIGSNRTDDSPYSENDSNVIESFVPSKTTSSRVYGNNLFASGVADIKFYYPNNENYYKVYSCEKKREITDIPELGMKPSYADLNSKCEMPLKHLGDMRAQWYEACETDKGGYAAYPENFALLFGTAQKPNYGCAGDPKPASATPLAGYEPIPILAAAERFKTTLVTPATPSKIEKFPVVIGTETIPAGADFEESASNTADFYWSSTSNNYNFLETNLRPTSSESRFDLYNHVEFNDTTSIIASESSFEDEKLSTPFDVSNFIAVAKEKFADTNSEVYIINTLKCQNLSFLNMSNQQGVADFNRLFFFNIMGGINTTTLNHVANLGGWTGITSLGGSSELESIFGDLGTTFTDNLSKKQLENAINRSTYDGIMINNTSNFIDSSNLSILTSWLGKGNRKLFIFFGDQGDGDGDIGINMIEKANAVTDICEKLDLKMKPLKLENADRYAVRQDFRKLRLARKQPRVEVDKPLFPPHFVVRGEVADNEYELKDRNGATLFYQGISLDVSKGGEALVEQSKDSDNFLQDDNFRLVGVPSIKTGVTKVNFPVTEATGYRIFVDSIAHSTHEKNLLDIKISNCSINWGSFESSGSLMNITDPELDAFGNVTGVPIPNYEAASDAPYPELKDFIGLKIREDRARNNRDEFGREQLKFAKTEFDFQVGSVMNEAFDVFIPSGVTNISLYFSTAVDFPMIEGGYRVPPATHRIVGISGATIGASQFFTQRDIFGEEEKIIPGTPEITTISEGFRQISNSSLEYCPSTLCQDLDFNNPPGPRPIADGPVVVAQELYFQQPFDVGYNRSRITVISDASMIQGKRIADENNVIRKSVLDFLQTMSFSSFVGEFGEGEQPNQTIGNYNVITKLISPVRGSPHKYFNSTGNSGLMIRFAGDGTTPTSGLPMSSFSDVDDSGAFRVDPDTGIFGPVTVQKVGLGKPPSYLTIQGFPPVTKEMEIQRKLGQIASFDQEQYTFGGTSKFSGIIDGTMYADAYYGQKPQLLVDKGYDYLDFDRLPSGYPGDLFGYSIALRNNNLVVGVPFDAFSSETYPVWADVSGNTPRYEQTSGTIMSYGGGAGSAYVFKRGDRVLTDFGVEAQSKSWFIAKKLRPKSINVGQDLCFDGVDERTASNVATSLGTNSYTINDLRYNSFTTDMFGKSIGIWNDLIVVGAPGHDFGNFEEMIFANRGTLSGMFNHKAFNNSVDIPIRNVYDLGESGVRNTFYSLGSGIDAVLNAGAIYTFEQKVSDWNTKTKGWVQTQKTTPASYKSRFQKNYVGSFPTVTVSGTENDNFGANVSVYQSIPSRTDSDYVMVAGAPRHQFATSGNHISSDGNSGINFGAVYVADATLRRPEVSTADSGITLEAKVFADSGINRADPNQTDFIHLNFSNSGVAYGEYSKQHENSGIIYSNKDGEIFLEVSGRDPSAYGYSAHRPYISEITGNYVFGIPETGLLRLYTSGLGPQTSGSMNLFVEKSEGRVLNSGLGLYANAPPVESVSGIPSGLPLYLHHPTTTTTTAAP